MSLPAAVPVKLDRRFGVNTYEIDEEQFLHPGELFDTLVNNESTTHVCQTGAFVARLNVPTLAERYVETVKAMAEEDRSFNKFQPLLLQRRAIWKEAGFYHVNTASEGDTEAEMATLRKKRKSFKETFLHMDMKEREKCHLEEVLDKQGVGPCIDAFYEHLASPNTPILYAANIDPSRFRNAPEHLKITEIASMGEMVSLMHHLAGGKHVGITTPTIYIGNEASLFQCHREDVSFQAINMHVAGAPKIWFVIPPRFYDAFCKLLIKLGLTNAEKMCSCPMQHKYYFVDPRVVLSENIPVHTIVQRPGDIVYLLPNAIHFGFNLGWNLNEAVNCASKTYAYPGMLSLQRCRCKVLEKDLYFVFNITDILLEAGVSAEDVAMYTQGKVMGISSTLAARHPMLHPELGVPSPGQAKQEHLLGPDIDDSQIGKFWQRCLRSQEDASESSFLGGYAEIELVSADEDEDGNENEEAQPAVKQKEYKCTKPGCKKSYQGRAAGRLRAHVEKKHGGDEDYQLCVEKLDELCPPRDKKPKYACEKCGKPIAGGPSNRLIHQNSKNCES